MNGAERLFYKEVRAVRRSKGLTQAELAKTVNCKQSAISMYEAGNLDALAYKTLSLIAKELDLIVPEADIPVDSLPEDIQLTCLKYCPIDDCPSNIPYIAGGDLHFKPTMVKALKGEVTRCAFCGEVLQDCCSNESCGASLNDGGFCSHCGEGYVAVTRMMRGSLNEWVAKRCDVIKELRSMSEVVRFSA